MSLIVAHTQPYSNAQLQLEDPTRWSRLLPLMRPSLRVVEAIGDQVLFIDTAIPTSDHVLVAAIGKAGNFSSKILNESHLAAFVIEQKGKESVSAQELVSILQTNGFSTDSVVVIRLGREQGMEVSRELVITTVEGELKMDHVLSLLLATKPEIKKSFKRTQEMLEHFLSSSARTKSTFHEQKSGDVPSVVHGSEFVDFSSAKAAIDRDLTTLLGDYPSSTEDMVYSVHYSDINGLSRLENNILAHEVSDFLAKKSLTSHISHSTIVDHEIHARGWAISLCALPATFLSPQSKPSNALANTTRAALNPKPKAAISKIIFSDSQVRKIITAGCERVIKEEPTITEYDTLIGDGDCGYTLRDGAKQVLSYIRTVDLSQLPSTLSDLVDNLEVDMGGTSGALYCIFLSSLALNLQTASTLPEALEGALEELLKYTRARLGDRTCLDCLIPFVETMKESGNAGKALKEAGKGVESTKVMEAKLGRSSYLDENATRGVPDPGAYGLLMLLKGMVGAQ